MKAGQKVFVSGEVEWGEDGEIFRVSTEGVIEEWNDDGYALVTLEYVDGDYGVCTFVNKSYINEIG
jgi:hypothetical protein